MKEISEKSELRRHYLKLRQDLDDADRREKNRRLLENLRSFPLLQNAATIGAYVSDGTEPDLTGLLDERFCFPRWNAGIYEMAKHNGQWRIGKYGLAEPAGPTVSAEEHRKMLWLIPGVAFDLAGNRLGRGGGWYDRLLTTASGVKIGVYYSFCQAEVIPVEEHDCCLDWIITENQILECPAYQERRSH